MAPAGKQFQVDPVGSSDAKFTDNQSNLQTMGLWDSYNQDSQFLAVVSSTI